MAQTLARRIHTTGHTGPVYGGSVASAYSRMPRRWRVPPHSRIPPGRAYCHASDPLLSLYDRSGLRYAAAPLLCPLLTPLLGSAWIPPPSARCRGPPLPWAPTEASRGQRSSRPCRDAGFIQHSLFVDRGLYGCVPARPDGATPCIRCVCLAPHVRSTLPSAPTSR